MERKLEFKVQGSAKEPYLTNFYINEIDNSIDDVRCSCPAGKRAGMLCKHVLAVIACDTSVIAEGSLDDLATVFSNFEDVDFLDSYINLTSFLDKEREYYDFVNLAPSKNQIKLAKEEDLETLREIMENNGFAKSRTVKIDFSEMDEDMWDEYLYFTDVYDKDKNYFFTYEEFPGKRKIKTNRKIKDFKINHKRNYYIQTCDIAFMDKLLEADKNKKEMAKARKEIKEMAKSLIHRFNKK